jgi:hypothetical protein
VVKDAAMVEDQQEIFRAVQQFYFHIVQNCGKPVHPRIQRLLSKGA